MKKSKIKKILKKVANKIFDDLKDLIMFETFVSEDNWERTDVSDLLEPEISKKEINDKHK